MEIIATLATDWCDTNLGRNEERRLLSSGLTCLPLKGLLMIVFHAFDLSTVFQMEKVICAVYSGYLEREMENISAHGPKKYT